MVDISRYILIYCRYPSGLLFPRLRFVVTDLEEAKGVTRDDVPWTWI